MSLDSVTDLVTFVNLFLSSVLSPLWLLWSGGSILSIGLITWLLREVAKSVRKLY